MLTFCCSRPSSCSCKKENKKKKLQLPFILKTIIHWHKSGFESRRWIDTVYSPKKVGVQNYIRHCVSDVGRSHIKVGARHGWVLNVKCSVEVSWNRKEKLKSVCDTPQRKYPGLLSLLDIVSGTLYPLFMSCYSILPANWSMLFRKISLSSQPALQFVPYVIGERQLPW